MRPRMYGSTDRKVLRTRISPSAIGDDCTSAISKLSGVGQPLGREARRTSRVSVSDMARTLLRPSAGSRRRSALSAGRELVELSAGLRDGAIDRATAGASVARLLHPAPAELRHLFKDATGVALRRYRLWLAMGGAVR